MNESTQNGTGDILQEHPEWERKLVPETDPILHSPIEPFNFLSPAIPPIELYNILGYNLIKYNGLGLSANQLGIKERCFVIKAENIIPFFNPRIISVSDENSSMTEGCLSFPGLALNVSRPKSVEMRFADVYGAMQTMKFSGLTAHVVLHELDHLDGITFTEKVKPFALKIAKEKRSKLLKKQKRSLTKAIHA